ncbi:hypothetical protein Aab01nite_82240 [Paractinoplanes abujensis]|nr:hypothetical protein Aab01nite_82240 [Actinoplanes abujensis]
MFTTLSTVLPDFEARWARWLSTVVLPIAVGPLTSAKAPLPRVDRSIKSSSSSSNFERSTNTDFPQ